MNNSVITLIDSIKEFNSVTIQSVADFIIKKKKNMIDMFILRMY